jgi:hypothetical protein
MGYTALLAMDDTLSLAMGYTALLAMDDTLSLAMGYTSSLSYYALSGLGDDVSSV